MAFLFLHDLFSKRVIKNFPSVAFPVGVDRLRRCTAACCCILPLGAADDRLDKTSVNRSVKGILHTRTAGCGQRTAALGGITKANDGWHAPDVVEFKGQGSSAGRQPPTLTALEAVAGGPSLVAHYPC